MFKPASLFCAVACWALPVVAGAQSPVPAQPTDWRAANEAVAQFPRGHADVLKWEQAHSPAPAPAQPPATGVALPSADHAVRLAWQTHRELAAVQARAGTAAVAAVAQGDWAAVDPRLVRRVHGFGELLAVAAQTRRAWVEAVAAQQVLQPLQERTDAADAAAELGQRMVAVGNWSALQLAPVQLARAAAHRDLARARYAAAQVQHQLLQALPPALQNAPPQLPAALPALPASALTEGDATARLQALHAHMPPADAWTHTNTARLALVAHQTSHAVAVGYRDTELPVRQRMVDETLLHYNGMLKSVWDVLTETGNLAQARVDAVAAHRDALLAQTDLTWVLQGGTPAALISLGGGTTGAAVSTAGH